MKLLKKQAWRTLVHCGKSGACGAAFLPAFLPVFLAARGRAETASALPAARTGS
jgi:hypothetical protein